MKKIELAEVGFTVAELRKHPQHSGFLVATCLAIHEIGTLQRAFLLSLNSRRIARSSSDAVQEYAFSLSSVMERNVSAKVLEYLKLIGDYPTICERAEIQPLQPFSEKAQQVKTSLKSAPGYELALWYRNSVTNHYLLSNVVKLLVDEDIGEPDREHSMYLNKSDGNSAYLIGERILLAKLGAGKDDAYKKMQEFQDWVLGAVRDVLSLHHDFCIQYLRQLFPDHGAKGFEIEIAQELVGSLSGATLPIFWDMDTKKK